MMPFDPSLAVATDYLRDATDLEFVVAGEKAGPFRAANWHPKVRGIVDGASVGVAWYEITYELKADATRRARELLRHVVELRRESEAPRCPLFT